MINVTSDLYDVILSILKGVYYAALYYYIRLNTLRLLDYIIPFPAGLLLGILRSHSNF